MTNIIINGAAGRMGQTLIRLSTKEPDLKLVGAIENPGSPDIGTDAGEKAGVGKLGVNITGNLSEIISKADVVIDFSSPEGTLNVLEAASTAKKCVVVGTTGHTDEQKKTHKEASKIIPLIVSPNMSVGVNLLWKVVEIAGKTLGNEYKIDIVERHHIHKKDAPSGTAKRLVEIIAETAGHDINEDVFFSMDETLIKQTDKPVTVKAIREGEAVGDHTVHLTSKEERIELAHHAFTRDIFGKGALRAAKWIVDKPVGIYDMQNVLF